MIQNVLRSVGGIEVVGIVSILLFFACFLGVLIWTFCLKKTYIDSVSRVPLEDDAAATPATSETANRKPSHE